MTTPIDTSTGPTALSKLPDAQQRAQYAEDWFRVASGFLETALAYRSLRIGGAHKEFAAVRQLAAGLQALYSAATHEPTTEGRAELLAQMGETIKIMRGALDAFETWRTDPATAAVVQFEDEKKPE